jgi:hypothetical protein
MKEIEIYVNDRIVGELTLSHPDFITDIEPGRNVIYAQFKQNGLKSEIREFNLDGEKNYDLNIEVKTPMRVHVLFFILAAVIAGLISVIASNFALSIIIIIGINSFTYFLRVPVIMLWIAREGNINDKTINK